MTFDQHEGRTGLFCNLIGRKPVLEWFCQSLYISLRILALIVFQGRGDIGQLYVIDLFTSNHALRNLQGSCSV